MSQTTKETKGNDMKDETEDIRREGTGGHQHGCERPGHALEAEHGAVHDTGPDARALQVVGFLAPYVVVLRRSDGGEGHAGLPGITPRLYFNFVEHMRVDSDGSVGFRRFHHARLEGWTIGHIHVEIP